MNILAQRLDGSAARPSRVATDDRDSDASLWRARSSKRPEMERPNSFDQRCSAPPGSRQVNDAVVGCRSHLGGL
jgi:hypothetical protein